MITNEHIQEFLAQAHRVGDARLTICSSGNLSWRIGEEALVSGTGSWVPSLQAEKVSICNIATGEVKNGVKPSMESGFHLGILRERPDVNVVLHFQSEYATAVACMNKKPTNFNVTAEVPCHVGREIPVIPYYRPGSPELAHAVVEAMKDHNSILLTNSRTGGMRKQLRPGIRKSHVLRNGLPHHCAVAWRLFCTHTTGN